jgi:hypothetical protein
MKHLDLKSVTAYVEQNIGSFHQKRLQRLEGLELEKVLKRKNPYLFKAKGIGTAQDLIRLILDAYLSSQEETIFGEFLEGLARFICTELYGGRKSMTEGIDLEFDRDGVYYIVAIKSGPNWGNSSQIKRMRENFRQAIKIFRTNNSDTSNIIAVNGCCYGRNSKPNKGDYSKLCGQRFWDFISGDSELYTQIVVPLGHQAEERNTQFQNAYDQVINRFVRELMADFFIGDFIDWDKLVRFNSAANPPKKAKKKAL